MTDTLTIKELQNVAKTIMPKGSVVWLYGSRARGDSTPESDWDILVLLDKPLIDQKDFDNISYPLIEFGWHYGADLSPHLYTKQEWKEMYITPYYQNVEHDKKVIYES